MKNIVGGLLVLIGSASAETFTVGQKVIEVPSPKGFAQVTPQMGAVYRLMSLQMSDPVNDSLAYYISESGVPVAMTGGMPPLERYCILKVSKKLKDMAVGSREFAKFKNIIKRQNKQLLKSIEAKMPNLMDKICKGISKEVDVAFSLESFQMIPLDPHYETDNAIAYSMYINYEVSAEGSKKDFIISATTTTVNMAGKILFLHCYGPREELEWTRSASKAWAEMVMESNAQPPSH